MQLAVAADFNQSDNVLDVHHAQGIVQGLSIDRKARMLRLAKESDRFGEGRLLFHGDDVGARHHHIRYRYLAEGEEICEHQALLRAQILGLAFALLDHLFEALAHG